MGHFAFELAVLRPSNISTKAAEQAHNLQKR